MNRMLIVVLGVLLQPPAPPWADLLVLGEPAQRLFRDLLRHAFHRVVGRRYCRTKFRIPAHVRQIAMEFLDLCEHRLRLLKSPLAYVESIAHRAPHRVMSPFDPDIVPENSRPLARER